MVRSVAWKYVAGAVLALGTMMAATGLEVVRPGHARQAAAGIVTGDSTAVQLSRAFRRATGRAMPGVVHVQVQATRPARVEVPDPFRGSPFEDLFRQGPPQAPAPRHGSGSGFVIREDGYILTNNHVVAGADRVVVVLQDRRELDAQIVGRDPNTDLAVLKVEAAGLPVVAMGDSDAMAVGDWVVALGYPLQLGATATAGIVSAKGRQLGIINRVDGASAPLEHFIQTDAAINPGNSGGPLVDLEGRVVGVNSAIASPTGYFSGYGFAVPINLARRVADDLIRHGTVRRPKLGVGLDNVDPADVEVYRLPRAAGAEVVQIEPGSAAEKAGIRLGDVIVAVDDRAVEFSGDLMELLALTEPGRPVQLEIVRFGQWIRTPVVLGTFEPATLTPTKAADAPATGVGRLGFTAAELTAELAARMRMQSAGGLVIVRVDEGGPAARVLRAGVLVEQVNGRPIQRLSDLETAAAEARDGQAVSLIVRLPDGNRTIVNYRIRG